MSLLQVVREARRRLAVQRALRRGERIDGLGLLGPNFARWRQRSAEGRHQ